MKANSASWKKKRQQERYEQIRHKFYIFCEGAKTEPLYFTAFKRYIEDNPIYKNIIIVEIEGLGRDTMRVIEYAEEYVNKNNIAKAQIWCVYDKDDFPAANFDGVWQRADTLNKNQKDTFYHVAWSNQCIEYWFILHFDYYDSDNNRKNYMEYLKTKFKSLGLKGYKKNDPNVFDILLEHGSPKSALKNARKRLDECKGKAPSLSAPATTVNNLVAELAKFFPDDIRERFI
jgi:hypothetical protein